MLFIGSNKTVTSSHLRGILTNNQHKICMLWLQIHTLISNIASEFNVLLDTAFSDGVIKRRGMYGCGLHWILFFLPLLHYQVYNDSSKGCSHTWEHNTTHTHWQQHYMDENKLLLEWRVISTTFYANAESTTIPTNTCSWILTFYTYSSRSGCYNRRKEHSINHHCHDFTCILLRVMYRTYLSVIKVGGILI